MGIVSRWLAILSPVTTFVVLSSRKKRLSPASSPQSVGSRLGGGWGEDSSYPQGIVSWTCVHSIVGIYAWAVRSNTRSMRLIWSSATRQPEQRHRCRDTD